MKFCSMIAYVAPAASMPGYVHVIPDYNLKPDDVKRFIAMGYYKAHVVAIEVADESAT